MSDAIIRSSPAACTPHGAEQREKAQPLTFSQTNKKEALSLSLQSLSLYQTPQTPLFKNEEIPKNVKFKDCSLLPKLSQN